MRVPQLLRHRRLGGDLHVGTHSGGNAYTAMQPAHNAPIGRALHAQMQPVLSPRCALMQANVEKGKRGMCRARRRRRPKQAIDELIYPATRTFFAVQPAVR